MDKNRSTVLLRVLISVGFLFFIANLGSFYLVSPSETMLYISLCFFLIQMAIGLTIMIMSFKVTKKAYQIFIGLLFLGWGLSHFLIMFVLPNGVGFWWPLYLIEASVFLFVAGMIKYKKIKFGFIAPSVTLFCMGAWYALFSFKIIKISFRTVVLLLGPAFMVLIAIFLVSFFLVQQRHHELVIHDDESGGFDDEELIFPKID